MRPDSMLILRAAREVIEEEDFQDTLNGVTARMDEIENRHRTRELMVKYVFCFATCSNAPYAL